MFTGVLFMPLRRKYERRIRTTSSQRRYSVKKGVLKKQLFADVVKDFVYFSGKHLCWSLFLIKLQPSQNVQTHLICPLLPTNCLSVFDHFVRPAALLKRDFNTGFFLWNLQDISEHLRTTASGTTDLVLPWAMKYHC